MVGPRTEDALGSLSSFSLSLSVDSDWSIGRSTPFESNTCWSSILHIQYFLHISYYSNFSFRNVHRSTSAPSSSTVFTYILSHSTTRSSLITHYFLILSSSSFLLLPSVHSFIHPFITHSFKLNKYASIPLTNKHL